MTIFLILGKSRIGVTQHTRIIQVGIAVSPSRELGHTTCVAHCVHASRVAGHRLGIEL